MLAGRDDYTPAPLAIDYAERMRAAGNGRIKVKVFSGAHHGWESLGPVFDIRDAENWSCCKNFIEDDGNHFVRPPGAPCRSPNTRRGRVSIVSPAAPAPAAARPSSSSARRPTCWLPAGHGFGVNRHSRRDSRGDIVSA